MVTVKEVGKEDRRNILEFLSADYVKHVFACYDLQYDPEHSAMQIVLDDGEIKGYLLVYSALNPPSAVLECEESVASQLVEYAPEDHFIMHTPPNIVPKVTAKYPYAKTYLEDWMLIKRGKPEVPESDLVRRLDSRRDAAQLAKLMASRKERPENSEEECADMIRKMPIYGVFIDGKIVSYAGSFIQLPQIWMIGGVYTHPDFRGKGYATLATLAVTKEALSKASVAALFARSDNAPALRAYYNIGYRKIGNKMWVDIGTGLMP